MKKSIIILLTAILLIPTLKAQELKAVVTVNSDRIQGTNQNIFTTLENALNQFVNNYKWSTVNLMPTEQIDCSFGITIMEQVNENHFKAELFVQSSRPVYNSSYTTMMLNWRDASLEFDYMEGGPIEIQNNYIESNLVATIAFYCNLILALDFDSFSPLGGAVFYREAQRLANSAQGSSWSGWSTFDDNRSKTAIVNALISESMSPYRQLLYTYHRKGLDEMAANADRSRTTILNALPALKDIKSVRDSEIILQMFADTKVEEIVLIAEKATAEEKKETYDLLKNVFPAMSTQLEPLKK